jgi:uncharacterized protein YggL (DUF469 family)
MILGRKCVWKGKRKMQKKLSVGETQTIEFRSFLFLNKKNMM